MEPRGKRLRKQQTTECVGKDTVADVRNMEPRGKRLRKQKTTECVGKDTEADVKKHETTWKKIKKAANNRVRWERHRGRRIETWNHVEKD